MFCRFLFLHVFCCCSSIVKSISFLSPSSSFLLILKKQILFPESKWKKRTGMLNMYKLTQHTIRLQVPAMATILFEISTGMIFPVLRVLFSDAHRIATRVYFTFACSLPICVCVCVSGFTCFLRAATTEITSFTRCIVIIFTRASLVSYMFNPSAPT